MKVLLLHEMSGVHSELKKGLATLGVDVKIATFGDGWKKYDTDINLGTLKPGLLSHLDRIISQASKISEFRSYDVIQLISPNPFYRPINSILQHLIFSNSKKLVYIAARSDAIYRKHVQNLTYSPPP